MIQNMVYMTIFLAGAAGINVGVITVIWSIDPVYTSIADYFLFGQKLHYNHFVGIASILCCSVVISLSDYVMGTQTPTPNMPVGPPE